MGRRADIARDLPRLGLNREESAAAIGVCGTTFDKMVREGRMPRPKMIGSKKLWFLESLKAAFMALPEEEEDGGKWDDVAA
jgi:predicted DNA-binding transcriptional regulator AlpA